jgi:hypothetical protein
MSVTISERESGTRLAQAEVGPSLVKRELTDTHTDLNHKKAAIRERA